LKRLRASVLLLVEEKEQGGGGRGEEGARDGEQKQDKSLRW